MVTYFLGDRWVLPRFGNVMATVFDAVTGAVIIEAADWSANGVMTLSLVGLILILGALTAGEWFFHKYLTVRIPN